MLESPAIQTLSAPAYLDYARERQQWRGLQTVVLVRADRRQHAQRTTAMRDSISSLATDARRLVASVRKHWGIENSLHWILDVAFREGESRMRKLNSPENFAMVRHDVAHIFLKQERAEKVGIQAKRMKAAWDRDYLPSPFRLKCHYPGK